MQFFNPGMQKKPNEAPSVWGIVICRDHRHLWRDSYKGVDGTLTSNESVLHKIIIIIDLILILENVHAILSLIIIYNSQCQGRKI